MPLRIEMVPEGPTTTIRLIGRMRGELLTELAAQIEGTRTMVVLDLEEVNLVDLEVVQFLGACLGKGIRLVNCSPYITVWIAREQRLDSHDPQS